MKQLTLIGVLITTFCSTALLAQTPAKDPRIGNWKQNVAKSTYAAGTVAPQMSARTYASRPDGYFVIIQVTVGAQGNAAFNEGAYKIDGKDYATYDATTLADFAVAGKKPAVNSFKLVDPNTVEVTFKDNTGKVTSVQTNAISKDGKTLTVTRKDATGKTVPGSTVWEKQTS